jgi:hypothetical protein
MTDSNRTRRTQQISGLIVLCRKFFGLTVTEEEAAAVLATSFVSARELPELIRKLRVLH